MSRNRSVGTSAEKFDLPVTDKLCELCRVATVPSVRHTYCEECGVKRRKMTTRSKDDKRRAGCLRCGGDKGYGRGSRFCEPCREAMLPTWRRAELERARRRSENKARANPSRKKKWDAPPGTKWCNRCEQYRPVTDFGPRRDRAALAPYCIPCTSVYGFEVRLRKEYGLTLAEYEAMADKQGGRCAICLRKPAARRLAVDHNHKTGRIRGLLCTRCNHKLLGASNEDSAILRRAADYLDSYAEEEAP